MRAHWISAHPEPRSLTASLRRRGIEALEASGAEVVTSDLYAMQWDPVVSSADFVDHDVDERLLVGPVSGRAFATGTLSEDIRDEQRKLDAADLIVVQFPLWWFGMPAILKGWFDRVFVMGFGYPFNDPERPRENARYGEGRLAGKRALLVVTSGSSDESLGPRGINGPMEELLFPIQHGMLFYAGAEVLEPFVVYLADWLSPDTVDGVAERLSARLASIVEEEPIDYRSQRGGDYGPTLSLRPELAHGHHGSRIHRRAASGATS